MLMPRFCGAQHRRIAERRAAFDRAFNTAGEVDRM